MNGAAKAAPVPDGWPEALRRLRQISDALQAAQESLAQSQFRLPRPEDYEPLAAPLREFARVSPALVEALRDVIQATRPMSGLLDSLHAAVGRLTTPPSTDAVSSGVPRNHASEALARVESARDTLLQALAEIPREPEYARAASQLRELATVSPSLMEWLREVPKLAAPLAGSVASLRRAVDDLDAACDLLSAD